MTPFEQVTEFHEIFGHPIRTEMNLDVPEAKDRYEYIDEEIVEFLDALFENDFVEKIDALGDVLYVVEGACLVFGFGELELFTLEEGKTLGDRTARMAGYLTILQEGIEMKDIVSVAVSLSAIKTLCYDIATRLGVNLDDIVTIIHEANLSKLGEDGKPIYTVPGDPTTKVVKGPNFVKPNKKIEAYLSARS